MYQNSIVRIVDKVKTPFRNIRDLANETRAKFVFGEVTIDSEYKRIYHYHIRKTAGTSLNAAFWNLAGLDMLSIGRNLYKFKNGYVFVLNSKRAIERGHYFFANSHTPAHKLRLPPDTFTLTVLRSPIDRVLSFYRYMCFAYDKQSSRDIDPLWKEAHNEAQGYFKSSVSFQEFLNLVPRCNLSSQLYMFSKEYNVEEALEGLSNCSAVLFTDEFEKGVDDLSQVLKLPLEVTQERRFNQSLKLDLSPDEISFLTEKLTDEIDFYEQAKLNFSSLYL